MVYSDHGIRKETVMTNLGGGDDEMFGKREGEIRFLGEE